jgi:hypothetical protein
MELEKMYPGRRVMVEHKPYGSKAIVTDILRAPVKGYHNSKVDLFEIESLQEVIGEDLKPTGSYVATGNTVRVRADMVSVLGMF